MSLFNTPRWLESEESAFLCWYCGVTMTEPVEGRAHKANTRTTDHVFPLALGGTHMEHNLVPCCNRCNQWKGARTLEEFRLIARPGEDDTALFYAELRERELPLVVAQPKVTKPFNDTLASKLKEALAQ